MSRRSVRFTLRPGQWLTRLGVLLGALLLTAGAASAQGQVVYFNNFTFGANGGFRAQGVNAQWSRTNTSVTPNGRFGPFLGQFGQDSVTLTLTGLPPHISVVANFKVFIINTWDGNNPPFGPDSGAGRSTGPRSWSLRSPTDGMRSSRSLNPTRGRT